ncbi:MAG: DUF1508 domain-containing protein [bacterium]|nr:DUF1508 domain-containing protein [bacterium]
MKGKVEFYKDKKGEFRWRLKASNGQQIANGGEGYTTFANCEKGFESVIKHAPDAVRVKDFE